MHRSDMLRDLHDDIRRCTRCCLHKTRKNAVPGEGPVDARVFFVGEASGAMEDEQGRPFVGRSGTLLIELINEIGLSRGEVFITSVLKSRPPSNRPPHGREIGACRPYLDRQLEIINPRVTVLLGAVAITSIIGPWKVSEAHGRFYECNSKTFFMTYHPAAALRSTKVKEIMHNDFEILRRELCL